MPRNRTRSWNHRVACVWPTALPGVYFEGSGKWTVQYETNQPRRGDRESTYAVGWQALSMIASGITQDCQPVDVLVAQAKLSSRTTKWTPVAYFPGLQWKARIALALGPESRARAQVYADRLRETHLQCAKERARITALRDSLINDSTLARAWWLDQHGSELGRLPWNEFSAQILPALRSDDDPHSTALRVASILEEVLMELQDDPGAQKQLILTAREIFGEMGWHAIAEKLPAD